MKNRGPPILFWREAELEISNGAETGLPKPLLFDFLNIAETHARSLFAVDSCTQNHPSR
jgi:hypothetical protein